MEDNTCLVKDTCGIYDRINDTCKYMQCGDCFRCNRMFRLNKLFDNSLISEQQRKYVKLCWDGNGVDEKEFKDLDNIVKNIKYFVENGFNLYLYSSTCGNGKTSWSLRFIQRYFCTIWKDADITRCHALFINVPRFLLALKDNISERSEYIHYIKENIYNADLVVWDDVGTKFITPFESENLLSMIDARMCNGKSNIFTSNMQHDELRSLLGERLASRIINGSSEKFEFKGIDKRRYKN